MRGAGAGREALRVALREAGGTFAEVLADGDLSCSDERPGPPQIAAAGPRAAGSEDEYELLLEMIVEGSRLHYGGPRVVATDDPDLALLLGDELYARGLSRLASLGDVASTSELADVISLVAQAHAAADPWLADAIWEAGAAAIGWGTTDRLERAKALARAGDSGATAALLEAAALARDE